MNNLNDVRTQKGFRLMQLTAVSGVSATTLNAIERYDYQPRDTTKERIAQALGVEVERIWPNQKAGS